MSLSTFGSQPQNYYGAVSLSIGPPIMIGVCIMLHRLRHLPIVRFRGYPFLLAQHLGMIMGIVLYAAYMMIQPHAPCPYGIWVGFILFPIFVAPILMRCWIFSFLYYLTREREKRPQGVTPLMARLVHVLAPSFLYKLFGLLMFAFLIVPTLFSIPILGDGYGLGWDGDMAKTPCTLSVGLYYALAILAVVSLILVAVTTFFIFKAKDAYNILIIIPLYLFNRSFPLCHIIIPFFSF
eukprot:TRINITY_DN5385_c0_g2_i7.p1 TRINITY_DN5385_c0_g2~~TRINITY_DN5385_c0_g2_i7.p1  ORF type:complete len:275 (+),score=51.74 TRINITY_DN5385_c0_g2_i7:116-826(+)